MFTENYVANDHWLVSRTGYEYLPFIKYTTARANEVIMVEYKLLVLTKWMDIDPSDEELVEAHRSEYMELADRREALANGTR